jgi:excisionase family DNA binding protein
MPRHPSAARLRSSTRRPPSRPETDAVLIWDIDETAARLGKTPWAIRGLVARKRIPFLRVGGRIYFSPRKLQEWIESRVTPVK